MASSGHQHQLAKDLDYLTDAAHLLREAAPDASAHLMRHRADLMFHNNLAQHELQRQHVCSACGHIMVPGLDETTMALQRVKTSWQAKRKRPNGETLPRAEEPAAPQGPTKELTCGRCHRITRVGMGPPPAAVRGRVAKASAAKKTEQPSTAAPAVKPSANASSKKRAKNRKAGLQALLSGQQKPALSLSLADFMKK
ncbi:PAP2 domain-containingprotein [Purpureocillium lavendulum]|uniref:PAP2 domain-containingprotein n=1 Tax=Purpureocillium lavendulum TaxID=1247861 RepID=A0AB34FMF7_9HYPO|nr:PAP2 domain-containingprotein [Purpureocillium lavendulum]